MAVLVTGGAGYIGSVTVARLLTAGRSVVVLDDLSTGHRAAVDARAVFCEADIADRDRVAALARDHRITACIHLAALSIVADSVAQPDRYRDANEGRSGVLLRTLRDSGVERCVFSSSASVYGEVGAEPIDETAPCVPTHPYGASKLAVEHLLAGLDREGLRSVALRYFNAAGASAVHGEDHDPETHLIPNVIRAALRGDSVPVFGDDYATRDGSCVRDYVHVEDLADAHLAALEYLEAGRETIAINVGSGTGHTVFESIAAVERVLGPSVRAERRPRRAGDPPHLVASFERARRLLGWRPARPLDEIVASAVAWHRAHPHGYARA